MKRHIGLLLTVLLLLAFVLPTAAQEEVELMPLTERGDYRVGGRNLTFVDEARDGRSINVWLWYPGIVPEGQEAELERLEQRHLPMRGSAPDMSGAPYPLVLVSIGYRGYSGEFSTWYEPLVSHGIAVAYVAHPNTDSAMTFVDRPLDVLYVIDQLATFDEESGNDLAGVLNTERIGVIGSYSGGFTALSVSGARVDPTAVSTALAVFGDDGIKASYRDWDWEAMTAYHDRFVPAAAEGELWAATADPRVLAVAGYRPCDVWWQFGERGLASATVPTMIFGEAEAQDFCMYESDTVPAYTQSGADDRFLITLTRAGTSTEAFNESVPAVRHFITAFFGYYLQGNQDYAQYLTESYVERLDNIVWGIDETAVTDPRYISELSYTAGGTATIGQPSDGEIVTPDGRMGYNLTLDAESALDIFVHATGPRTSGPTARYFDPVFYVLDEAGELMVWNDEYTHADDMSGHFDAGLEGITLPAGGYTIVVDGFGHETGPYELIVSPAE